MDSRRCHEHLRSRGVAFATVERDQAPEVAIPVRLRGPIAGVEFVIPWSDDPETDHHAIWDCRLVAAMLPLASWLRGHGFTEVQYFSALRRGRITRAKPRSRHNVGLAIDILGFKRGPGQPLYKVEEHYPRRTLRSCPSPTRGDTRHRAPGDEPLPGAPPGDVYLGLVCHAYRFGLVHTLLTPDHDRDHHNHLHLDLKTGQASPPDPYFSFHGR
ncbi:MAG: hypothetical protein H6713_30685 [Myxococcales bacterium]|nr:hypothetical protein [Myxococcales bacterium]